MLNKRFTFLCDQDDRRSLKILSERLRRSQGNVVRFLIRAAVSELAANPDKFSTFLIDEKVEFLPMDTSGKSLSGIHSSQPTKERGKS